MRKTPLEHFQDIKELEVADEQGKTVVDILPYKCEQVEKSLKALEIIKKHFIIKISEETELNGNIWGRLVSIQSKEDEGTWDTTACANLVDYKEEYETIKEVLEC